MNNTNIFSSQWKQLRAEVKRRWGMLTEEDLNRINGSAQALATVLHDKYGYAQPRAEEEVQRFLNEIAAPVK